ncbi:WD40-repeat-containing domain protein [Helicostylum pulchrum]|nr:WD40-repeat-containing domain protein [Helicostylum pulchrum]
MSINLQKCLKERRIFGSSPNIPYGYSERSFSERIYADKYLISQLTCERELPGHTGCVNTLDWSLGGDKLLSGSDDKKLNIYKPFEDYKIATVINTGHRANIFCAKFMPQTSDNVIISGAGDSEVRIFDLRNIDSPLFSMYVCHSDQVKKICVYDNNPNEFLTCSQDGTVRSFDLRVPHICSPHSVRSFLTARKKPARQFPIPEGHDIQHGCPNPILDYSRYNTELNSMTINKLFPHYFAVAGMNDYIYLHDRRMMPANYTQFGYNDPLDTLKCIKRFSPTLDGFSRPNKHITACKFSDSNGYELIGSWSSDDIYLFNINDSPAQSSSNSITTGSKRKNSGDNESDCYSTVSASSIVTDPPNSDGTPSAYELDVMKVKSLWPRVIDQYLTNDFNTVIETIDELIACINSREHWNLPDLNLLKACAYFVRAAVMTKRLNQGQTMYTSDQISRVVDQALSLLNTNWKSSWCTAVGYWLLSGGNNDDRFNKRQYYIGKCLEYARKARSGFREFIEYRNSRSSSSNTAQRAEETPLSEEAYRKMLNGFSQDVEFVCVRNGYIGNTFNLSFEEESEQQVDWIKFMFVNNVDDNLIRECNFRSVFPQRDPNQSDTSSSSSDVFSSDTEEDEEEEEDDELSEAPMEDEESLYTQIMSRQIMDIYRRGNEIDSDEDDSDFDLETINILNENINYPSFDTDVGVVKPRMKYSGHCNIETVKDVDFFGLRDEYIVSGSDKGYVFIWDKKTGKIVQILHGDEDVVNVTKGHPFLPIMAVSGIDSTVKIFKPTSRLPVTQHQLEPNNPNSYSTSSRLYDEEEIVSSNRESNRSIGDDIYMTRSVYAAFLRMERQRRLLVVNGILDDEEAEVDRALTVLGEDFDDSSSEST